MDFDENFDAFAPAFSMTGTTETFSKTRILTKIQETCMNVAFTSDYYHFAYLFYCQTGINSLFEIVSNI